MALINYLTQVRFGAGVLAEIADDIAATGIGRPLIVTDQGVIAAGLLQRLTDALPRDLAAAPVFDQTPMNPTEAAAIAAAQLYSAQNCDGLIALGGGSALDLAKAVALLATHPGPLAQYALIEGGVARITAAIAPVIAVPTTAGTGSEVGRAAVMTLADGRKLGLVSQYLIPRRAICDPELTLGMPAWLTAATGMDAVAHCIESFLTPAYNPPAEAIALDGLARALSAIEVATADGSNIVARTQMMMAALMGGLTFQKGLGLVHGLSHPLGSLQEPRLHHGTLNAILLPPVLRFNRPGVPADKWRRLCDAMGVAAGAGEAGAADRCIEGLNTRLGLPASLAAMGVLPDMLGGIAEAALNDHTTATNPRQPTRADCQALLDEAMASR